MDKLILDVNDWSYRDYQEYMTAANTGNMRVMLEKLQGMVISWPYEVNPQEEKAYEKLPLAAMGDLVRAATDRIKAFAENVEFDEDKIVLDLSAWNVGDFLNFNDAVTKGNADEVIRLIRLGTKVSVYDDGPETELSFVAGVVAIKAINERISSLLTTGN